VTPEEFAERLAKAAVAVPAAVYGTLVHEGNLLRALIQANASGRPGPNIVTGAYHASWQVEAKRLPGGGQVTVGTMKPQGRRLEFGFVGTDSLGRTFNQPPFPHVGPAVTEFSKKFPDQLRKAIGEAMG
jgi:hypothetical protein